MHIPAYVIMTGLLAQAFFSARIIFQWVLSERARRVVSPSVFWILSLAGSFLLLAYGWMRSDFSIMLGQIIGYYVYIWNLQIKGVWAKLPKGWDKVVVGLLFAAPVLCMGALLIEQGVDQIVRQLFHNRDVPLWLLIFGSAGQVVFSLRFLYQWYYSAKRGRSILPAGFWVISLMGCLVILAYGCIRRDPILLLAQAPGMVVYSRNLYLCFKYGAEGDTDTRKRN